MEGRHPSEEAKVASAFLSSPARVRGLSPGRKGAGAPGRGKPLLLKHHPLRLPPTTLHS